MRIHIAAVGRLKKGPEQSLSLTYLERAGQTGRQAGVSSVKVIELPESTARTAKLRKADEAQRLLAALPDDCLLCVLDETGKDVSSRELAGKLQKLANGGQSDVAFVVGGPDGHGDPVKNRAHWTFAFGRATWPHRLIRIMLAEQIYRSVTIMVNHPYHRD